jgi:hypothetical protein
VEGRIFPEVFDMTSFCDVEFCSVVVFFVKLGCKVCGVLGEVVEG